VVLHTHFLSSVPFSHDRIVSKGHAAYNHFFLSALLPFFSILLVFPTSPDVGHGSPNLLDPFFSFPLFFFFSLPPSTFSPPCTKVLVVGPPHICRTSNPLLSSLSPLCTPFYLFLDLADPRQFRPRPSFFECVVLDVLLYFSALPFREGFLFFATVAVREALFSRSHLRPPSGSFVSFPSSAGLVPRCLRIRPKIFRVLSPPGFFDYIPPAMRPDPRLLCPLS